MNLESIDKDIKALEAALSLVEKTTNAIHFEKSQLITGILIQIHLLESKRDRQLQIKSSLNQA